MTTTAGVTPMEKAADPAGLDNPTPQVGAPTANPHPTPPPGPSSPSLPTFPVIPTNSARRGSGTGFGVRTVELSIDELVLHGFPPMDRYRVADALNRELTVLLQKDGIPAHWVDALEGVNADVSSAPVRLPATPTPETVGRAIAHALLSGRRMS